MVEKLKAFGFDESGTGWYKRYNGKFTLVVFQHPKQDYYNASIMIEDCEILMPVINEEWLIFFDNFNNIKELCKINASK